MGNPSYSFVDLREAIAEFGKLRTDVAALSAKIDSAPSSATATVGSLVEGAMSLVNQRLAQYEATLVQHEQHMANMEIKLKAAIPQVPDMGPLAKALQDLVATMTQQAARVPADPPGIAALAQTVTKLTQSQQELCARMDKPVVREGIADLPSGQIKLRITETRQR